MEDNNCGIDGPSSAYILSIYDSSKKKRSDIYASDVITCPTCERRYRRVGLTESAETRQNESVETRRIPLKVRIYNVSEQIQVGSADGLLADVGDTEESQIMGSYRNALVSSGVGVVGDVRRFVRASDMMSLVRSRTSNNRSNDKTGAGSSQQQPPASSSKSTFFMIRIDPIRDTVGWLRGKARRKESCPPPPYTSTSVQTTPHQPLYLEPAHHTFVYGIKHAELDPLCKLPEGMNYREWMATNVCCSKPVGAFFSSINVLYAPCREFCVPDLCPSLSGYSSSCTNWIDERGKKTKVTGIQYMDLAMECVDKTLQDETLFPRLPDPTIPNSLDQALKKMMRLLFQILCHLYDKHFEQMVVWKIWPHLNSVFLHLLTFGIHFKLMDTPKDTDVLNGLYWILLKAHKKQLEIKSEMSLTSDDGSSCTSS